MLVLVIAIYYFGHERIQRFTAHGDQPRGILQDGVTMRVTLTDTQGLTNTLVNAKFVRHSDRNKHILGAPRAVPEVSHEHQLNRVDELFDKNKQHHSKLVLN